ncbi:MAG: GNAT family N-acetyltransferase [Microbacterium sp. SCN 70-200]|mgnify:CR=1 FL=1|uniref:GNAT family N-acetyltransferase n=1 Tax=unclassified Microbacterium TaxID=2609290 RepID=UPI00086AE009|nr:MULTISPECIES: GNAT family N-acetyltransferase [unclassified Microbacterium]MBN9213565.1 GNAT family N-acetyltransferase [Microbacterium sp.]ODT42281.1 MAG: GNAT family N-acetyltransferase [Microbacterium sp. SCN 70-200]OJV79088.1 MAG: GNAT family N-acetyltransferase [Microbacterium sp. 70-16]
MTLRIAVDDLSGAPTRALLAAHLAGMQQGSPPESVHALDLAALRQPEITVWSAWRGDDLVGVGALKQLDASRGELKSMRVDERFLGTGAGRALLRHIMTAAAERGIRSLWLETGSEPAFAPARGLYASEGFVECGPFDGYLPDPLSTFMTREL